MNPFDLHAHSTASDGLLSPTELVQRAASRGVKVLALTDHDQVSGLAEAEVAGRDAGIRVVGGTELSVTWRATTVHVVGLDVDPASPALRQGLESIRAGRGTRAARIAASLAQAGVAGALEGAMRFVTNTELVSRTHFARFLVDAGHVPRMQDAFRRFLTPGKPGYVRHTWAELADAVRWIRDAGGQAVLAHPGRYKVSRTALLELLAEFRDAGGEAIEILTSNHTPQQSEQFAAHARRFGFLGSCGSDFHGPGESWLDLGALPALPSDIRPVWQAWS
jgi:predicted metal-dependent phosphoesterase TrpH